MGKAAVGVRLFCLERPLRRGRQTEKELNQPEEGGEDRIDREPGRHEGEQPRAA